MFKALAEAFATCTELVDAALKVGFTPSIIRLIQQDNKGYLHDCILVWFGYAKVVPDFDESLKGERHLTYDGLWVRSKTVSDLYNFFAQLESNRTHFTVKELLLKSTDRDDLEGVYEHETIPLRSDSKCDAIIELYFHDSIDVAKSRALSLMNIGELIMGRLNVSAALSVREDSTSLFPLCMGDRLYFLKVVKRKGGVSEVDLQPCDSRVEPHHRGTVLFFRKVK